MTMRSVLFVLGFLCVSRSVVADTKPAVTRVTRAIHDFFIPPAEESSVGQTNSDTTGIVAFNGTTEEDHNHDLHDIINKELAEDEERVMAQGEVKTRKKRFFCKRCLPTFSYGYGGGGGCCGSCGGCGRRVIAVPIRVSYGGGGRGCCGYRPPCGVCGRK